VLPGLLLQLPAAYAILKRHTAAPDNFLQRGQGCTLVSTNREREEKRKGESADR